MRRVEVTVKKNDTTRIEGPTLIERNTELPEKSVDDWCELTVRHMFEAAENALKEQGKD